MSRTFIRHKVYGSVFVVEVDPSGEILAAASITDATACRHRLGGYTLALDEAAHVMSNLKDFEPFEPACTDAAHLLADIGDAERECDEAETTFQAAHSAAKAAKELFETKQQALRALVRQATLPARPLPLFDEA
jgi:hypothetical protein